MAIANFRKSKESTAWNPIESVMEGAKDLLHEVIVTLRMLDYDAYLDFNSTSHRGNKKRYYKYIILSKNLSIYDTMIRVHVNRNDKTVSVRIQKSFKEPESVKFVSNIQELRKELYDWIISL